MLNVSNKCSVFNKLHGITEIDLLEDDLNSRVVQISVDLFYILGGFFSLFGITLNFLCFLVVKRSKIYNQTCYGLYLKYICITDIFKLIAEYQFRIVVMSLYTVFLNCSSSSQSTHSVYIYKFLHCNLRLGFVMITENLSYAYCIVLAADRVCRIWNSNWTKRNLPFKFVKKMIFYISICVLVYCHPHFYPIDEYQYVKYPSGFITKQVYSDCTVLTNKLKFLSFDFYWQFVESFVNSFLLPAILVTLNIILSIGIFWKCRGSIPMSYNCHKLVPRKSSFEPFIRLKPKKKLYRVTREASLVVLADTFLFLIVITPVNAFTYFYSSYDSFTRSIKTAFSLVGLTISLVNHSFNGIVYIICSKTFRNEFLKTIKYLVKNKNQPTGTNTQKSRTNVKKTGYSSCVFKKEMTSFI